MGDSTNILMVYYSFEGNVEFVSQEIAKELSVDLFRIEPAKEPPRRGPGKFFAGGRDAILKHYPEINKCSYNLSDYHTMIIASPVWAGTYAPAIGSFLRDCKFQGKRIYLIASCSSGKADKMLLTLEDSLIGNNVVETLTLRDPLKNQASELPKIQGFCRRIAE